MNVLKAMLFVESMVRARNDRRKAAAEKAKKEAGGWSMHGLCTCADLPVLNRKSNPLVQLLSEELESVHITISNHEGFFQI